MANFTKLQELLPIMADKTAPVSKNYYKWIFYYWGLKGKIAYDVESEAILWRSRGRRKAGSEGTRYTVHVPNGELYTNDINGTGKVYDGIFSFIAMSDDEAIEKANEVFSKKYEKYCRSLIEKEL